MATTRGIRKVSENILADGRAIIVTDKDKNNYKWADIPLGSKFIDTKTGIEYVKLEGESDWVPAGIKNDGTICIAKDSYLVQEVFTIITLKDSDGKNFTYMNEYGDYRHMPITENGCYVFELEKASYQLKRNYLEVFVDNVLRRDVASGALSEISETRFSYNEPLEIGTKVYVRYLSVLRIGNPYPRTFLSDKDPEVAEEGDFWLDQNYDENNDANTQEAEKVHNIDWSEIDGKPTTVEGYGIRDNFSRIGHLHYWADITDRPSSLAANGGNAATVAGCTPGTNPDNILKLDSNGKIPASVLTKNFLLESGAFFIQSTTPVNPREFAVWFDITKDAECIKVLVGGTWISLGAVWK